MPTAATAAAAAADFRPMTPLALLAAALLAGFAVQRGNVCTLAVVRDLLLRRDPARLLALLHAQAWCAGLLAASHLLFGGAAPATAFAADAAALGGGVLLGLGAVVNGACVLGTLARLGQRQWAWLATLPGLLVGALCFRLVPAALAPARTGGEPPLLALAWSVAAAFAAYVLLFSPRALRRPAGFGAAVRGPWPPLAVATALAVAAVLGAAAGGPWSCTGALAALADGRTGAAAEAALPSLALLGGALLSGAIAARPTVPAVGRARPRDCFVGGALMGLGGRLAGGNFDGHLLLGQPLLLPHAWTAMAAAFATMAAALLLAAARGRRG